MAAAKKDFVVTEFEVWYDGVDGARRHMRALDQDGVNEIISSLHDDEARRSQLAKQFGLPYPGHEYNISVVEANHAYREVKAGG